MPKMTKAQGRRRLAEMQSKAFKLLGAGYISMKDYEAVRKIVHATLSKKLK